MAKKINANSLRGEQGKKENGTKILFKIQQ